MKPYNHQEIEQRWQSFWKENELFRANRFPTRPKKYILDMFPYPSGYGLHVGHVEGYTATDILARYYRMQGYDVLHPMGWDAFGLPTEQHALQTGKHPANTTRDNVANFRRQLDRLGFSYDWNTEINTTDPDYVRWTQWMFLQFFKKGLAYQSLGEVNWCPDLGTVLSKEEVIDGKSERGGFPVTKLSLRQWMLRITAYADRLKDDLKNLDWPESTLTLQKNWIKSMHDWTFARQRYWGEPIPIYFPVHTESPDGDPRQGAEYTIDYDSPIAVDESELPLPLPTLDNFKPSNDPAGPLARQLDWRFFKKDGKWYARETNTMPQWAGSCWYYLRFLDPKNTNEPFDKKKYNEWMPVDIYVGGIRACYNAFAVCSFLA